MFAPVFFILATASSTLLTTRTIPNTFVGRQLPAPAMRCANLGKGIVWKRPKLIKVQLRIIVWRIHPHLFTVAHQTLNTVD